MLPILMQLSKADKVPKSQTCQDIVIIILMSGDRMTGYIEQTVTFGRQKVYGITITELLFPVYIENVC